MSVPKVVLAVETIGHDPFVIETSYNPTLLDIKKKIARHYSMDLSSIQIVGINGSVTDDTCRLDELNLLDGTRLWVYEQNEELISSALAANPKTIRYNLPPLSHSDGIAVYCNNPLHDVCNKNTRIRQKKYTNNTLSILFNKAQHFPSVKTKNVDLILFYIKMN